MKRKFIRRKRSKLLKQYRAASTKIVNNSLSEFRREEALSETEKMIWVYEASLNRKKQKVEKIISVTLVTSLKDENYTILYYDTVHDKKLHKHEFTSSSPTTSTQITLPVNKKGNIAKVLSWTLNDVRDNFYSYKMKYFKK